MECNLKYIDPSYIIRSQPANPHDSVLCLLMGQSDAATALFQVMDSVSRLIRSLGECFEDHDFILTPATEAMPWKAEDAFPTDING